jgi:hypothetical protein
MLQPGDCSPSRSVVSKMRTGVLDEMLVLGGVMKLLPDAIEEVLWLGEVRNQEKTPKRFAAGSEAVSGVVA